jgi:hypothetical protein
MTHKTVLLRGEVTGAMTPGPNELQVKVTNL